MNDFVIQNNILLEYIGNSTNVSVPSGITAIRWFGSTNTDTGRNVLLPNSVNRIYSGAFSAAGISSITLPQSVRIIGQYAFSGNRFQSIHIPAGVKNLEQRTFWKCKELINVTLSEGLESIDSYAFADCAKLQSLVIPRSVKRIRSNAFQRCYALTSVTFLSEETVIEPFAFDNLRNLLIIAPQKSHAITYAKKSGFRYREQ